MWAGAHRVGPITRARLSIIGHSAVTRSAEPQAAAVPPTAPPALFSNRNDETRFHLNGRSQRTELSAGAQSAPIIGVPVYIATLQPKTPASAEPQRLLGLCAQYRRVELARAADVAQAADGADRVRALARACNAHVGV